MKRLIALFVVIGIAASVGFGSVSLRRPASMIEASLLGIAPIGTLKDEVVRAIEKKGWTHSALRDTGFTKQASSHPMEIVGKKSIEAHLGEYGLFLKTSVDAFWGFDEDGKLLGVWVWKTTDAP